MPDAAPPTLGRWAAWRQRAALRRCEAVGVGVRVSGRPHLHGSGRIILGSGVVLYARPVRCHLVTTSDGVITLGERVIVGHGTGITAFESIDIGDDTVIGPFSMIVDTDFHDLLDRQAPGVVGPIRIGRGVRLGPWVTVLRGTQIGDGAVIAAGSVVRGRVPAGARIGRAPGSATLAPTPRGVLRAAGGR